MPSFGAETPKHVKWRRLVRYLPAEPGWWADFTDWTTALDIVRQLGLPDEARDWPISRLSTGERLWLALARALTVAPKVLLLDEPTAALNPASVAAVESLIQVRASAGFGVLWVTHDVEQARRVGGRLLIVSGRQVREELIECPVISR